MSAPNYANTYTDACTICHGHGYLYEDDGTTHPPPVVRCAACGVKNRVLAGTIAKCGKCQALLPPCSYCQGYRTSGWALLAQHDDATRAQAKVTRRWVRNIAYLSIYIVTLAIPGNLYGLRILLFPLACYWAYTVWNLRPMTPRRLARRRFTTPEEAHLVRAASWGLVGGLWLKDSLHRHAQAQARSAAQAAKQAAQQPW